jgi:hypothetical protein
MIARRSRPWNSRTNPSTNELLGQHLHMHAVDPRTVEHPLVSPVVHATYLDAALVEALAMLLLNGPVT